MRTDGAASARRRGDRHRLAQPDDSRCLVEPLLELAQRIGVEVGAPQLHQEMMCCRSAVATACVRVSASSFAIALRTCVRTVSAEMCSCLPISSFA